MAKRDGRTEQPTQRKLREAKRKGQVPRSQETSNLVVLGAAIVALANTAPGAFRTTAEAMRFWLGTADGLSGIRSREIQSMSMQLFVAWSPAMLAAAVAGIAIQVAQGGLTLAPETARPAFKHLSLKKGLQTLSPTQAGMTLARSVMKITVIGLALVGPLQALWDEVPRYDDLPSVVGATGRAVKAVAWRVVIGSILVAAIDAAFTRRKWKRELMMTRQEVLDEARLTEGDPHTKAARKRKGFELRRRGGLPGVAQADVVVTNPTHFAVALAYTDGSPAPQVIDKGTERAAKKIRKIATRNGVPIIEDKPLARALYRQVRVGGYVPERFFDDVIKVLVAAYWRRGRFPDSLRHAADAGRPQPSRSAS